MKTEPRSSEWKRKTARTRRARVRRVCGGCLAKDVLGGLVSILKPATGLTPMRPARSTPITAKPWDPSAKGCAGVKGEAQGKGALPSSSQRKLTGRFAEKVKLGRELRSTAFGPESIVTRGGSATSSISECASSRPPPTVPSPSAPTRLAVARIPSSSWDGVSEGFACSASAATAAACGAAAEVPQKT